MAWPWNLGYGRSTALIMAAIDRSYDLLSVCHCTIARSCMHHFRVILRWIISYLENYVRGHSRSLDMGRFFSHCNYGLILYLFRNKCIGDDTKAAARRSLNCIKNKKKYRPSPSPNGLKAFTFLHAIWLISTLISTQRVLPGPYAVRQGRWGPCGRLYHHLQIARRRAMNHSARHCVTACAADASAMSRSRIIWKCTQAIPLLQTAGVLC